MSSAKAGQSMTPLTIDRLPAALRALISEWAARPQVQQLRLPAQARGACVQASDQFVARAQAAGLRADVWPAWADQLGISRENATCWPDDSHAVCAIWLEERIFTVDWTAAQYGITSPFPLIFEVQRLPKRDPWLLTEQEAEQYMRQLREQIANDR